MTLRAFNRRENKTFWIKKIKLCQNNFISVKIIFYTGGSHLLTFFIIFKLNNLLKALEVKNYFLFNLLKS